MITGVGQRRPLNSKASNEFGGENKMKRIGRWMAISALVGGLAGSVAIAAPLPSPVFGEGAQYPEGYYTQHPDLRQLIEKTQEDLQSASEWHHAKKGDERDRYRNAQKSLSTFDRHLTKGKFDKGELDKAIGDIQSVLDHNTLQASSRDALLSDVQNLRLARKAR
jgi:hypothetical protein